MRRGRTSLVFLAGFLWASGIPAFSGDCANPCARPSCTTVERCEEVRVQYNVRYGEGSPVRSEPVRRRPRLKTGCHHPLPKRLLKPKCHKPRLPAKAVKPKCAKPGATVTIKPSAEASRKAAETRRRMEARRQRLEAIERTRRQHAVSVPTGARATSSGGVIRRFRKDLTKLQKQLADERKAWGEERKKLTVRAEKAEHDLEVERRKTGGILSHLGTGWQILILVLAAIGVIAALAAIIRR